MHLSHGPCEHIVLVPERMGTFHVMPCMHVSVACYVGDLFGKSTEMTYFKKTP